MTTRGDDEIRMLQWSPVLGTGKIKPALNVLYTGLDAAMEPSLRDWENFVS